MCSPHKRTLYHFLGHYINLLLRLSHVPLIKSRLDSSIFVRITQEIIRFFLVRLDSKYEHLMIRGSFPYLEGLLLPFYQTQPIQLLRAFFAKLVQLCKCILNGLLVPGCADDILEVFEQAFIMLCLGFWLHL
jgi:hypothetical protein